MFYSKMLSNNWLPATVVAMVVLMHLFVPAQFIIFDNATHFESIGFQNQHGYQTVVFPNGLIADLFTCKDSFFIYAYVEKTISYNLGITLRCNSRVVPACLPPTGYFH